MVAQNVTRQLILGVDIYSFGLPDGSISYSLIPLLRGSIGDVTKQVNEETYETLNALSGPSGKNNGHVALPENPWIMLLLRQETRKKMANGDRLAALCR